MIIRNVKIQAALWLLMVPVCLSAQIHKVEPLNWWVGMKDPHLQLMVYGKEIGETTPAISYPGVQIQTITPGESINYLFIDLLIDKSAKAGALKINFVKKGKNVYSYSYDLLERKAGADQRIGFNASDVIYLIVPDRFANGNYSNDVVAGIKENKTDRNFEGGRHGGDIRGIIDHLDYIAGMGFTAIWPTPVLENDMPAFSYHGYAITDHYKVDPRYGTLEEYKELSAKAKQKGIKLIFDEVLNHTGSGYWWMNDLPFKNWLNYSDSLVLTTHIRTSNQDKYAAVYDKKLMTKGWFDKTMPDMNAANSYMASYLIQNTIWWIETLDLGGIRQDTYGYSDKAFLTNWSCRIMNEYPNFSMVGEEWSLNPMITSYWQQGKTNHDGYESCLTSVMDFPLQAALVQALKEPEKLYSGKGISKIYEAMANDFVYPHPENILVMGDNHDMDRLYTQLNNDAALTKIALTFLLTIRGIPQVFYGTELLMQNADHLDNHGYIRSDFAGGWKEDKVNGFSGAGLSDEQKEMQSYLKKLLNWRKNTLAVSTGKTLHFAPFNGIYVYFRYTDQSTIMVILNKNDLQAVIDPKRFLEILGNKREAKNIITLEVHDLQNDLVIPGKIAAVFEVK